jgi:putative oxidoreductase
MSSPNTRCVCSYSTQQDVSRQSIMTSLSQHETLILKAISLPVVRYAATTQAAALFLISALGKITSGDATAAYMEAYGVPSRLRLPAALLEIACAVCLLLRMRTSLVASVLAGWCILTAVIFHVEWSDENQVVHFLKNFAMAGAFLLIADLGELRSVLYPRLPGY